MSCRWWREQRRRHDRAPWICEQGVDWCPLFKIIVSIGTKNRILYIICSTFRKLSTVCFSKVVHLLSLWKQILKCRLVMIVYFFVFYGSLFIDTKISSLYTTRNARDAMKVVQDFTFIKLHQVCWLHQVSASLWKSYSMPLNIGRLAALSGG